MKTMQELVDLLNRAAEAYYNGTEEIMSNYEYDALFDELKKREIETGIILENSPTQRVGYDVTGALEKDTHETPALSLDKTKDGESLASWLSDKEGVLSYKMDGLTIVATYDGGGLTKAVTRGNGITGDIITHNAKYFHGLPQTIPNTGHVVVRGEAIIDYNEFNRINEGLSVPYKNPRNLASGTVRALDSVICRERQVEFYAFQFVTGSDDNSFSGRLQNLEEMGFQIVPHQKVNKDNLPDALLEWTEHTEDISYPVDGLVLEYDDIAYGQSLGSTSHHPRYGMAFKWQDEVVRTKILDIEWSPSRTGLLNPVAIFEPVEIEGTTVSRASVHNLSVLRSLHLFKDDTIGVYKANMIIPQVSENFSYKEGNSTGIPFHIPDQCPICQEQVIIKVSKDDIETLQCLNRECPAKHLGNFERFVDRDAMNIEGLSTQTLETFIQKGFIHTPADLYYLENYKDDIIALEGFGNKSYENIVSAIEKSKTTTFERYLYSLGIPEIGRSQSKAIKKHLQTLSEHGTLWDRFIGLLQDGYDFSNLPGFGMVLNYNIYNWFNNEMPEWEEDLAAILTFENEEPEMTQENWITGKTFVVTGDVHHFANRNELKAFVEKNGGKVSGSVSSKTDFLINNDITSNSGKNQKAKQLDVPIISEDDFLQHVQTEELEL